MLDAPYTQVKKSKYSKNPVPFKLSAALENETQFLVATTLPCAKHINKLWELVSDLRDEIAWCLNMVYSHITMRGAHGQGNEHFFHHVAGTALYESHQKKLIKGKNHGLKAGVIVQKLLKTIKNIKRELDSNELSPTHRDILDNFKAELIAHHNTLVLAVKKLSPKDQKHLKRYQNLDPQSLVALEITSVDEKRIIKLHPPAQVLTPKKLSKAAHASKEALQTTEPPVKVQQRQIDIIFAQLIQGTSFDVSKQKPEAARKIDFTDKLNIDEIDIIFAKLETPEQRTLTTQFALSHSSQTIANSSDPTITAINQKTGFKKRIF
jgi:hypothetical protein